jgi:hypothetical protein
MMTVIAKVYDYEITDKELAYARTLVSSFKCGCNDVDKKALEYLVDRCLLLNEANKFNLGVTDDEWNDKIFDISTRFDTKDEYMAYLDSHNLTRVRYEEALRENVLISKFLDKFSSFITEQVSNDIGDFVDSHSDLFSCCSKARVYNILIADNSDEGYKRALNIRKQIETTSDFQEMADKYSECPSNVKCGDMGIVTPKVLIKELDDVIFSIDVNEVSLPIKSEFGYHLILVTERCNGTNLTEHEKSDFMFNCLIDGKSQMYVHSYVAELHKDAEEKGKLEVMI